MSLSLARLTRSLNLAALALGVCQASFASDHEPATKPAASAPARIDRAADKSAKQDKAEKADKSDKADKLDRKVGKAAETEVEVVPMSLPKPRVVREPMDVIRERLAEKLGSPKAAEPAGANELHVVSNVAMTSTPHATANVPTSAIAPNASGVAIASVRPSPRRAARVARPVEGVVERRTDAVALAAPMSNGPRDAHWDYQGLGNPETWGQLKPEFSKCSSGTRQSPIDIRDGIKVQLDPVVFSYRDSAFTVVDNGHTVQVDVGPGSSIEVMGHRYELVQFHFHRPSEERINGRQFDMSVHLVHKDVDGRLAVIAVELDRGSVHPAVQKVWNNLPLEKGDSVAARSTIEIEALLPQDRRYFTYMGSLTTPPCSEGVLWMVMKQPVEVAPEQIGIFARLYPMNARPIQQASGRLIKESN